MNVWAILFEVVKIGPSYIARCERNVGGHRIQLSNQFNMHDANISVSKITVEIAPLAFNSFTAPLTSRINDYMPACKMSTRPATNDYLLRWRHSPGEVAMTD